MAERIRAIKGEVIEPGEDGKAIYRRPIPYPAIPEPFLPRAPRVEVPQTRGFLGIGSTPDRDALAHRHRLREMERLGVEVAFAEEMGIALEIKGIATAGQGLERVEHIAFSYPADSLPGMVADDMASEMAARVRLRHRHYMETYDSGATEILRRR